MENNREENKENNKKNGHPVRQLRLAHWVSMFILDLIYSQLSSSKSSPAEKSAYI